MSARPASGTWLTPVEVMELTDYVQWKAQCRALAQMNIPFRPNRQGRPLVERAAVLRYKPKGWDAAA